MLSLFSFILLVTWWFISPEITFLTVEHYWDGGGRGREGSTAAFCTNTALFVP